MVANAGNFTPWFYTGDLYAQVLTGYWMPFERLWDKVPGQKCGNSHYCAFAKVSWIETQLRINAHKFILKKFWLFESFFEIDWLVNQRLTTHGSLLILPWYGNTVVLIWTFIITLPVSYYGL